ncbi:MAG: YggT family protein [Acidobacteria bacterium]|nr:YggT family protein [Acidobacteriota bacterium]
MLPVFVLLSLVVWYAVVSAIFAVVVLVVLRWIVERADLNPFGWLPRHVRGATDPLVNPVRRGLARAGLPVRFAPFVTVLIAILLGYFCVRLFGTVFVTLDGLIRGVAAGAPLRVVGYALFGVLAIYTLLIFMRIVFSWGASQVNRVYRFLVWATDPILLPFRRLIPPVGMFDISPIIVILLLQLLQEAVAGTLLAR